MCGICGIVWKQRNVADEHSIKRMNDAMTHRGPDDEGYYTDGATQLAMRRLAIIDLQGGHQPITTPDGRYTIVFNGEIYNYLDIRNDLLARGHKFATNSDTETILLSYVEWGGECVHRLRGMFAFAIWDRDEDALFLARDRLGIKPLLYTNSGDCFAFGSELKVLLQAPGLAREFDYDALYYLLAFQALPTPLHLIRGVRSIPPGWRGWYRNGSLDLEEYWDVSFDSQTPMTEADAIDGMEEKLRESVRIRLMSEVPLGGFLSGGVDSSLVVSMMAGELPEPVRTFNIGWGDEYGEFNEVEHARAVAERYAADHHEHLVTVDDLIDELPEIVWHYDQPTPSAFQAYFVSKFTRQAVTVALSGLGGDEIAAGYDSFGHYARLEKRFARRRMVPRPLRKMLSNLLARGNDTARHIGTALDVEGRSSSSLFGQHRMLPGTDEIVRSLCRPDVAARTNAKAADWIGAIVDRAGAHSMVDQLTYLELRRFMIDDPLTDTDRCSMAHSLEVRVPFLDHELVEFACSIPPGVRMPTPETKYLLKKVAERYIPKSVIYRPKMGFSFPMVHWVPGPLKPLLDQVLSPESVRRRGLFELGAVAAAREQATQHPSRGSAAFVWNLAVLELWCRLYLDVDTPQAPQVSTEELIHQMPVMSLG